MLQVVSLSPEGLSLLVRLCCIHLKEFVVNWFKQCAFSSHAGEWLALAMVILLSFASCIASLKFVFWLLTRKRDTNERELESDKQYWRIHGE